MSIKRLAHEFMYGCRLLNDLLPRFVISHSFKDDPLPPRRLMYLVNRTPSAAKFLKSGSLTAKDIVDLLKANGVDMNQFVNILDFGCGCGRVIRHFKNLNGTLYGTDFNKKMIAWCRSNLCFARFFLNGLKPPLNFDGSYFDFIYAFSVFTHLSIQNQILWMNEFRRILKDNGYVLISLRNEDKTLMVGRMEGSNYYNSYLDRTFVKSKLAKEFSVVSYVPKGTLYCTQDFWLLRKVS